MNRFVDTIKRAAQRVIDNDDFRDGLAALLTTITTIVAAVIRAPRGK